MAEFRSCDIVAIGEVLIDFTCESKDEAGYPLLQAHPGGAPANFLAAAAKLGARTSFIGKVGNDAFGRLLLKTLASKGIDTSNVIVTEDAFTTLAFVTLDEKGDREFSFARKPGADSMLRPDEISVELIKNAAVLHMGSLLMTTESGKASTLFASDVARENCVIVSYDPNYRPPLWKSPDDAKEMMLLAAGKADMMKISEEEAEFMFGFKREDAAEKILEALPQLKLVMVTLGPDGAVIRSGKNEVRVSAPKVTPVDTTGAGDICGGSLAAGLLKLEGFDPRKFAKGELELSADMLEKAGRYAVWAASMSTMKHGGMDSVPSPEEFV
ncbi:MAG: carbohydrate kinase [Clostridia bacterium]|nr:carbohydrate kinase [Clostridia bacterium]